MTKHKDDEPTEVTPVEQPEPEQPAEEKRVAENGEVHDPGNSGLVGSEFTGTVEGSADKPNG